MVFFLSLIAILFLILRRKAKIDWVNHLLYHKIDDIVNLGPLNKEYNSIIIGAEYDHLELISKRSKKQIKKHQLLQFKKQWEPMFIMEILCMLIMPIPNYDKLIRGW